MKHGIVALLFIAVCPVFISCATVPPPPSIAQLGSLTSDEEAAAAEKAAPVAWKEGNNYLRLADEAAAEGKMKRADRLAQLGIIQIKIAYAVSDKTLADKRLEEAETKKQALSLAIAKNKAAVADIETQMERVRLRDHLVSVVDETRRKAAAEEEERELLLPKEDKRVQDRARKQVAREMLDRIDVWAAVLAVFVENGAIEENRLAIMDSEKKLADSAFSDLNLAGVQEHVENLGIKGTRLINEAWALNDDARIKLHSEIESALTEAGYTRFRKDYGLGFVVSADSMRKLKNAKSFKSIRKTVEDLENVHLVTHQSPTKALMIIVPVP